LLAADYWLDLARIAERGTIDFITIEDGLGLQSDRYSGPDGRTDRVRGRLDAVLVASRLAAATTHLGLIPTALTTHTEPFHVASAISTLDHVSGGRAGWRPQVSGRASDAAHFGRRSIPAFEPATGHDAAGQALVRDLFNEAADSVEVVRRLWDSWEDDAVIKDIATGRFIDREKLHYVDFVGEFFSVRGPSIVPRPPQGNPVVAALAHSTIPFEFAARSADVVFVTPSSSGEVSRWVTDVRSAEERVGREGQPLLVFADLNVVLGDSDADAEQRLRQLDEWAGTAWVSDAAVVATTPVGLVDRLQEWAAHGLDGFRLRPAVIDRDVPRIVDHVVPELRRRGLFRATYPDGTLRQRLGLTWRPSRFAAIAQEA
jgi:alkanesulfonate monooxygenase SsuD/methylene tetrahydromethanopterin reductase-like flavin-dependent oxidoreductase (luciferase family)